MAWNECNAVIYVATMRYMWKPPRILRSGLEELIKLHNAHRSCPSSQHNLRFKYRSTHRNLTFDYLLLFFYNINKRMTYSHEVALKKKK